MGWTQQRIAVQIGVPQQTLARWFTHYGLSSKVGKRQGNTHNTKAMKVSKPTFLSWCGRRDRGDTPILKNRGYPDALVKNFKAQTPQLVL
jgi:hypothetical protein